MVSFFCHLAGLPGSPWRSYTQATSRCRLHAYTAYSVIFGLWQRSRSESELEAPALLHVLLCSKVNLPTFRH